MARRYFSMATVCRYVFLTLALAGFMQQLQSIVRNDFPGNINGISIVQNVVPSTEIRDRSAPVLPLVPGAENIVEVNVSSNKNEKIDVSVPSNVNSTMTPKDVFRRQERVVIATKVHGRTKRGATAGLLKQMLCLMTHAYNKYVMYDIVIFSTLPWTDEEVESIRKVVEGANLTVVVDPLSLEQQIESMSKDEAAYLRKRCKKQRNETLEWTDKCCEENYPHCTELGYAWQAEFRAYNIWKQPVLEPYKYMLWFDSDALPTRPFQVDPVRFMVENDLVLLMDNFPQGYARNPLLQEKMEAAYNRSICDVTLDIKGRFSPILPINNSPCKIIQVSLVHGFLHVTNLDFYRSPLNLNFNKILVSSHRFSRQWDDQIAVTVPAAMGAPERAWDMRQNGLNLSIWHNGYLDGKTDIRPRGFKVWFHKVGHQRWPEGQEKCGRFVVAGGR